MRAQKVAIHCAKWWVQHEAGAMDGTTPIREHLKPKEH
jgi:hypothetical protein